MTRRVVVTGATSEIGREIARRVVLPGDEVLLQGFRNTGHLSEFEGREGFRVVAVDLADREALDAFCRDVSGCDILVNAAGIVVAELLPNLSDADIDTMLAVNIVALTRLCRAAVVPMMRRRSGTIVNIGSVAASRGNRGQTVYGGTKAFVEGFTRSLAAEFAGRGVRVNCVAPGAIEAGSLRPLVAQAPNEVLATTAVGRLGSAGDVADAVAFLVSERASFIHGQVLAVDGAFRQGVG
ncbi:MAG: SDR family oxidoreductase [Fibrobacteria bacterium]|nr:SDR family oxidoreductase [Fibrobacteria bacterium]